MLRATIPCSQRRSQPKPTSAVLAKPVDVLRFRLRVVVLLFLALGRIGQGLAYADDPVETPAPPAPAVELPFTFDFWNLPANESFSQHLGPAGLKTPLRGLHSAAQSKPRPLLQQLQSLLEAARAAAPQSPLPDLAYALACEQAGYVTECKNAYPALVAEGKAFFLPGWQAALMWELEHGREHDIVKQLPDGLAELVSDHEAGRCCATQLSRASEWFGSVTALVLGTRKLDNKLRRSLEKFASEAQSHALAGTAFTTGMERMRAAIEATRAQGLVAVSNTDAKKISNLEDSLTSLEEKAKQLSENKVKGEAEREKVRQQAADRIGEVDEALQALQTEFRRLATLHEVLSQFSVAMANKCYPGTFGKIDGTAGNGNATGPRPTSIDATDPLGRHVRAIGEQVELPDGSTKFLFTIRVLEGPPGSEVIRSTIEGELKQLKQEISKVQQTGLSVQQRRQTMINLYEKEMGVRIGQELKTAQFQALNQKKAAATQKKLEKTVKASRDKQLASAETYFSWNAANQLAQLLERVKE